MSLHKLHILISRTDTFVGATIRRVFGGNLNHCSIAFDEDFSSLYSFSRYYIKSFGLLVVFVVKLLIDILVMKFLH